MRWLILMMTSVVLGACAGSIGPPTSLLGSPSSREPTATDRVDPTTITAATTAPSIQSISMPTGVPGFRANLPDLGAAPELNNEVWLNTDRPMRLAALRGKVVVIDMWTFG